MSNANGTWVVRLAMGLATAGILGAVGTYAQSRENASDMKTAKEVHREIKDELKEIRGNQGDIREDVAGMKSQVNSIYDVIVKDEKK